jgi:hypothetical protein
VAKDLEITDKLSFGESFAAIQEASCVHDEWKMRFDAADAVKAAEAAKAAEDVEVVNLDVEMDDGVDVVTPKVTPKVELVSVLCPVCQGFTNEYLGGPHSGVC